MTSDPNRRATVARRGFFPVVAGEDVQVREGGGLVFLAKSNMAVTQGGGQWLVAGGDQTLQQSGGACLIAGKNQILEQSGGAVLIARQARITSGFVGLLIAGRTTVQGGARVLVPISVSAVVAGAAGLAFGLLLGRRRAPADGAT